MCNHLGHGRYFFDPLALHHFFRQGVALCIFLHEFNPLFDDFSIPPDKRANVVGRQRFGRIAIANSDSGAAAYTDSAIDQAHRAIDELLGA